MARISGRSRPWSSGASQRSAPSSFTDWRMLRKRAPVSQRQASQAARLDLGRASGPDLDPLRHVVLLDLHRDAHQRVVNELAVVPPAQAPETPHEFHRLTVHGQALALLEQVPMQRLGRAHLGPPGGERLPHVRDPPPGRCDQPGIGPASFSGASPSALSRRQARGHRGLRAGRADDRGALAEQPGQVLRNLWRGGQVQEVDRQPGVPARGQPDAGHVRHVSLAEQEQAVLPDVVDRRVPAGVVVGQEVDQAERPGPLLRARPRRRDGPAGRSGGRVASGGAADASGARRNRPPPGRTPASSPRTRSRSPCRARAISGLPRPGPLTRLPPSAGHGTGMCARPVTPPRER